MQINEPAAPEHSENDHPSAACHLRANSVVTASGWATRCAAARSSRVHASKSALAVPSGDAAGGVVVGRDATVVDVNVVEDEDEVVDEVVVSTTVVTVGSEASSSDPFEHDDRSAMATARPAATGPVRAMDVGPRA